MQVLASNADPETCGLLARAYINKVGPSYYNSSNLHRLAPGVSQKAHMVRGANSLLVPCILRGTLYK